MYWDKVNHWLTISNFMFDNWTDWFNWKPNIRTFNFFQIMWDTGGWSAYDLDFKKDVSVPHMNGKYIETDDWKIYSGELSCFFK